MNGFNPGVLLVVLTAASIVVPVARAQSELHQFLEAADQARAEEKPLLIYFHSGHLEHPPSLSDIVADEVNESIQRRAIYIDVDVAGESGRELRDAFFGNVLLSEEDQGQPVLGILPPDGRRGVTILGDVRIEPESWAILWSQVDPEN